MTCRPARPWPRANSRLDQILPTVSGPEGLNRSKQSTRRKEISVVSASSCLPSHPMPPFVSSGSILRLGSPERWQALRLVLRIQPRSANSAPLRLCGHGSFAALVPSREKCSEFQAVGINGARSGSKSKTQRGRANRKQTSPTSHGLVQQRIASTLRTRPPSILAIHASSACSGQSYAWRLGGMVILVSM